MYTILRDGGPGYVRDSQGAYKEFICDTAADIAMLPTGKAEPGYSRPRPGSTALVTATRTAYVLSNAREWVMLVEG